MTGAKQVVPRGGLACGLRQGSEGPHQGGREEPSPVGGRGASGERLPGCRKGHWGGTSRMESGGGSQGTDHTQGPVGHTERGRSPEWVMSREGQNLKQAGVAPRIKAVLVWSRDARWAHKGCGGGGS